jgi:pyruvate-ferredoxin/flavodoxin oxidoreductase
MYISNATGCSSIWGGSAPATPYTVNNESGRGPAWANSLFEDNAEHGLGMFLGQKAIRERLIGKIKEMMDSDKASDEFKAAAQAFIDTKDNGKTNDAATKALVVELEKAAEAGCPTAKLFSLRRITSPRSPYGSSVETDGHTTSDLAVLTTYSHPERT